jgi:hypothetical protein
VSAHRVKRGAIDPIARFFGIDNPLLGTLTRREAGSNSIQIASCLHLLCFTDYHTFALLKSFCSSNASAQGSFDSLRFFTLFHMLIIVFGLDTLWIVLSAKMRSASCLQR